MIDLEKKGVEVPSIVKNTLVKKVDFYLNGSVNAKKQGAWCSILLSKINNENYSKPFTGVYKKKDVTKTRVHLLALLNSLKVLNYKKPDVFYFVSVYTDNIQVSLAIRKHLNTWKRNGFKTKEGSLIKHHDLYREISEFMDSHLISVSVKDKDVSDKFLVRTSRNLSDKKLDEIK